MESVTGTAQGPALEWKPNAGGVVRTIDEALEIARAAGILIPSDVKFLDAGDWLPKDVHAEYFFRLFEWGDYFKWSDFYNRFGFISVKLNGRVLGSDEAIVAVFTHEMHELNRLREIFAAAEGKKIPTVQLDELVRPGVKGNLHCEAWDLADQAVLKMRNAIR